MNHSMLNTGMEIILQGEASNEAEGLTLNAMTDVLGFLQSLPEQFKDKACQINIVHASLGEAKYDTTPESAKIMATVTSRKNLTSDAVKMAVKVKLADISEVTGIRSELNWAAQ